jgi:DNA-binding GntR family transcriptional regulator
VESQNTSADPAGTPLAEVRIGRVPPPIRDQALDAIRRGILDFHLRPGQRLIERELIEQLGVSRPTIREVLWRLSAEGLVTIQPQQGAMVAVLTPVEAEDIYEMRVPLEVLVMRRFVERATGEEIAALRGALDRIEEAGRPGAPMQGRLRAKDDFYEIVFDGARSPVLAQTLRTMQGRIRLLRVTSLLTPGRPEASLEEIRHLVEAIERRDLDGVAAAATAHVRNASVSALSRLAGDGPEPGAP